MTRATIVLPISATAEFDRGAPGASLLPAPTNLVATAESGQVYLTWNPVATALRYNLYYDAAPGVTTADTLVRIDATATSYTLTGLLNGTTYYFRIAAVGAAGVGTLSSEASAVPSVFTSTRAMRFDGVDEYIAIPYSAALQFNRTSPFSISMWVKPENLAAVRYFLSNTTGANTLGYNVSLTAAELLTFKLNNVTGNRIEVADTVALTLSTWQHVVITYSGSGSASGVTLYVNGASRTTSTVANTLTLTTLNTNPLAISALSGGGSNGYHRMQNLGIYNIALSGAQVTSIYNAGTPAALYPDATGGLVGWWRLGNNDAFPVANDSFDANDGGMTNMDNSNIVVDGP